MTRSVLSVVSHDKKYVLSLSWRNPTPYPRDLASIYSHHLYETLAWIQSSQLHKLIPKYMIKQWINSAKSKLHGWILHVCKYKQNLDFPTVPVTAVMHWWVAWSRCRGVFPELRYRQSPKFGNLLYWCFKLPCSLRCDFWRISNNNWKQIFGVCLVSVNPLIQQKCQNV